MFFSNRSKISSYGRFITKIGFNSIFVIYCALVGSNGVVFAQFVFATTLAHQNKSRTGQVVFTGGSKVVTLALVRDGPRIPAVSGSSEFCFFGGACEQY